MADEQQGPAAALITLMGRLSRRDSQTGRRVSLVARLPRQTARRSRVGVLSVHRAAMHIQDAIDGSERPKPAEGEAARRAQLAHLWLQLPVRLTLLVYVMLTFFEWPGWAIGIEPTVRAQPGWYPRSGLPVLPRRWAIGVEMSCLAVLLLDLGLRLFAQGARRFFRLDRYATRVQSAYAVLLAAAQHVDCAVFGCPQLAGLSSSRDDTCFQAVIPGSARGPRSLL